MSWSYHHSDNSDHIISSQNKANDRSSLFINSEINSEKTKPTNSIGYLKRCYLQESSIISLWLKSFKHNETIWELSTLHHVAQTISQDETLADVFLWNLPAVHMYFDAVVTIWIYISNACWYQAKLSYRILAKRPEPNKWTFISGPNKWTQLGLLASEILHGMLCGIKITNFTAQIAILNSWGSTSRFFLKN